MCRTQSRDKVVYGMFTVVYILFSVIQMQTSQDCWVCDWSQAFSSVTFSESHIQNPSTWQLRILLAHRYFGIISVSPARQVLDHGFVALCLVTCGLLVSNDFKIFSILFFSHCLSPADLSQPCCGLHSTEPQNMFSNVFQTYCRDPLQKSNLSLKFSKTTDHPFYMSDATWRIIPCSKWLITMAVIVSPLRCGTASINVGDPNHLRYLGWSSK